MGLGQPCDGTRRYADSLALGIDAMGSLDRTVLCCVWLVDANPTKYIGFHQVGPHTHTHTHAPARVWDLTDNVLHSRYGHQAGSVVASAYIL